MLRRLRNGLKSGKSEKCWLFEWSHLGRLANYLKIDILSELRPKIKSQWFHEFVFQTSCSPI